MYSVIMFAKPRFAVCMILAIDMRDADGGNNVASENSAGRPLEARFPDRPDMGVTVAGAQSSHEPLFRHNGYWPSNGHFRE
jgi:hypothetical protein